MAALKQNVVNLDALIPRADLAVGVNSDNVKGVTLNTPSPVPLCTSSCVNRISSGKRQIGGLSRLRS
jgi:hypothetical protein